MEDEQEDEPAYEDPGQQARWWEMMLLPGQGAFFVGNAANAALAAQVANAGQSFVLALADAGALSWQLAADWDLYIYQ